MTDVEIDAVTAEEPAPRPNEGHDGLNWRRALSVKVASRVATLQSASVNDASWAVARLAQLRRAVGMEPGSIPDVWDDTIGVVPEGSVGRGDAPTAAELAAHHAVSLFALHRRGRIKAAHKPGRGLGEAVGMLAAQRTGGGSEDQGVRRRFDALVTASTPDEGAYHLRGLVMMLRDADIGLDYGSLAEDLAGLWTPSLSDGVRLRWARQYRYLRRSAEKPGDSTTTMIMTHEE